MSEEELIKKIENIKETIVYFLQWESQYKGVVSYDIYEWQNNLDNLKKELASAEEELTKLRSKKKNNIIIKLRNKNI